VLALSATHHYRAAMGLRFQVLVLPNIGWTELLARAKRVEELGFDCLAIPDHLVDWTNPVAPWHEAWTALGAIAASTSRVRLTTLVTQIPLRAPALLARQALTIDHASAGRLEVGLGTGLTIDPSYPMGGWPNWEPAERVRRFGEYVAIVAAMLAQEVTTFHGSYYSVDGVVMNPRPLQSPRPPIMVAALAPLMMRHAVRHADIWNSMSFTATVDEQLAETRRRCTQIDELCAAEGRDPATLRRSYLMFDASARHHGGAIGYYESPERFVDEVQRFAELGITDIGLYHPIAEAQVATFERIATDVLPALRSATAR
jgi:alkanesulfonate monooxygenase SsuD/methylene tetrahydromethanopterin reductase-like flavin-dependent oxidoreductase (luciferase family)